jgi:hypothetical protein
LGPSPNKSCSRTRRRHNEGIGQLGTDFKAAEKRFADLLSGREPEPTPDQKITVGQLADRYLRHAQIHYRKNGRPTSEQSCINAALKFITDKSAAADDFGPLALKAVRQRMIDADLARSTINSQIARIRLMFKWAVAEQLVPIAVYSALETLPGLREGRSAAREPAPILPIDDSVVDATLPHLSAVVADKVHRLGHFDDPWSAALAYDEFARKNFGEFAKPNFKTPAAAKRALAKYVEDGVRSWYRRKSA